MAAIVARDFRASSTIIVAALSATASPGVLAATHSPSQTSMLGASWLKERCQARSPIAPSAPPSQAMMCAAMSHRHSPAGTAEGSRPCGQPTRRSSGSARSPGKRLHPHEATGAAAWPETAVATSAHPSTRGVLPSTASLRLQLDRWRQMAGRGCAGGHVGREAVGPGNRSGSMGKP
jgi:hypothetical protein